MEQPNMMQNHTMQRPQSGNAQQQMHAAITDKLRRKAHSLPQGWQSTFDIGQRANRIMQMVSGLRMLHQEVNKCIMTAESFEERTILESPSKELYYDRMQRKLQEIMQKRQQAAQQLQNGQLGMSMNNNMNNNGMGMAQNEMNGANGMNGFQNGGMSGMNMDMGFGMNMQNGGGMGMPGGQMGGMTGMQNQNFPTQLQRPMQASPLPFQQQQQQQQPPNGTMDPSALQNPQMAPQMSNMGQPTPQPAQQPQQTNINQGSQNQPPEPAPQEIMAAAKRLFAAMPEDQKNSLRPKFVASLPEQQRQSILSQGGDPLLRWTYGRAREMLIKQRAAQMGQQSSGMQNANNMGMPGNNMQQTQGSQSEPPNFNFSNMQANAIKSQESGGEVVPASNNSSMNMGGQMNMSQGVNPQMIGNQNSQSNNSQQLQMQFMAMQQEKQRRDFMMKNQLAQQQARQQQQNSQQQNANAQNQLRGQPGGLTTPNNVNGGQTQSPANNMTMLTRPIVPPGQAPTPTMPQTPMNNGASQLAQHHQNMLNQNNQQMNQQGGLTMAQRQQLLNTIPLAARERLAQMAPQQVNEVLQRLNNQRMNAQATNQLGQQGAGGMPPNPGAGTAQIQNQQQMMPNNFGNGAQQSNQQNQQQPEGQGGQSLQFRQQLQQHQQNQLRQRALDLRAFPKQVLKSLGMSVPDHVNEWGKLKQHIAENQSVLPPNSLQNLQNLQAQWFSAHPEEIKQALQELQQRMQAAQQNSGPQQPQQQPQQPSRPPSSVPNPNGQAPPATMVPPTPMQQPPNQNVGGPNPGQQQIQFPPSVQTPTAQEVQMFRQRFPQAQNLNDDQIKAAIMRQRTRPNPQQQQQQQQQMRNQAPPTPGFPNAAQQGQMGQINQQQQQSRQMQPQQQGLNQQNNQGQGQKRPQSSNDDVLEISNPNARPQAPAMQMTQSQQRQQAPLNQPRFPSDEEIAKMPPDKQIMVRQQMRQMEALRRAQLGTTNAQGAPPATLGQQPPQQPPAQQQPNRLQAHPVSGDTVKGWFQDVIRATPKGQAVQVDSKGLDEAQASLKKMWPMVQMFEKTFGIAGHPGFDENRMKQAFRARIIVLQNASDANGTIRDFLSVTPAELHRLEAFLAQYFVDLRTIKDRKQQQNAGQGTPATNNAQNQQNQPEPPKQQAPQQAQPQSTAAVRKGSQQTHTRKASASTKAPPAPTDNKTFDWGSPSPHGVPKYNEQVARSNELTADKLKFPPPKKRKTGPQAENQASPSTTPQATTTAAAPSPLTAGAKTPAQQQAQAKMIVMQQQQRQQQQQMSQPKAKYQCDDLMCDASVSGFETEAELKQHKDTVHQPVDDPLKFMLDSAAQAFGFDSDGKPLSTQKDIKMPGHARVNPKTAAKAGVKREMQTPNVKQESATPGPKTSTTPAGKKTDVKVETTSTKAAEKEKTLMEAIAEKVGFEFPTKDSKNTLAPEISIESAEDAWIGGFQSAFGNTDSFLDDWADFARNDEWSLRPGPESSPELTPSDQASQSSRESDISQSEKLRINLQWDPFGNGDTALPESLMMETLGIGEAGMNESQNDTDVEKSDDKTKDQWDWSNDIMDWDSMFGANAGLDDNNVVLF